MGLEVLDGFSHFQFGIPKLGIRTEVGLPAHAVDGSEIRRTTWDVKNPVYHGINYLSTGAGFLPSAAWGLSRYGQIMIDCTQLVVYPYQKGHLGKTGMSQNLGMGYEWSITYMKTIEINH